MVIFMKNKIKYIISIILIIITLFNIPVSAAWVGDVDDDGEITAADARLALRMSVGLEEVIRRADIDVDGSVSAADARQLLRISVGLERFEEKYYSPFEDPYYDDTNLDIMSIRNCSPIRAGLIYKRDGTRTTYDKLAEGEVYFQYDENGYDVLKTKPYSSGNAPVIDREHCSICGKKTTGYDGKHYGCYYGYCERWMQNVNCPECDEFVKANTCHTCK